MGSSEGATDNGSSVSDDPELGRRAPELRQSPGHLARGDNRARAELVYVILQGLTKYKETNIAANQNCTNVTALPTTNHIRGYLTLLENSPSPALKGACERLWS